MEWRRRVVAFGDIGIFPYICCMKQLVCLLLAMLAAGACTRGHEEEPNLCAPTSGTRQASDSDSVKSSDISILVDTAWAGVTTFRY